MSYSPPDILTPDSPKALYARLTKLLPGDNEYPVSFTRTQMVYAGVETRRVPREYYWDGMKRGGDPKHPYVVFQYSLDGWGYYEEGDAKTRIEPGSAFIAVVPTEHRYYLPAESTHWSFLYLIFRDPYVVERLTQASVLIGHYAEFGLDTAIGARMLSLFEGIIADKLRDEFEEEMLQFEFMVEFSRFAYHTAYPQSQREKLLNDLQSHILTHITDTITVTDLADRAGMSRTHYSHYFKSATGLSPASFIRSVRLEEAVRMMLQTDYTLEHIACETGFAGANDLCKIFRRQFHTSPTAFRRQMNRS